MNEPSSLHASPTAVGASTEHRVFLALRRAILHRRLAPGTKTTVRDLAEDLGVSPTPVRVALKQLEGQGLVQAIPRKYVLIKGPTMEELIDVNRMRSVLEGLAVRLSTEQARASSSEVRQELKSLEEADRASDFTRFASAHNRFHLLLDGAHSNTRLYNSITDLYDYIEYFREIVFRMPAQRMVSMREHQEISHAFESGDAIEAERLTRRHVESFETPLREYLAKWERDVR